MYIAIAFILGIFIGTIAGIFTHMIFRKIRSYDGVMKIIREEDKIVYSLELREHPVVLANMSEVVFKVESSDKSSNRE